jgi:hypothetical protein
MLADHSVMICSNETAICIVFDITAVGDTMASWEEFGGVGGTEAQAVSSFTKQVHELH